MTESAATHSTATDSTAVERTALAWTRTGLALLAGAALATRLTSVRIGAAGLVVGLGGAVLAVIVLVLAGRRHEAARRSSPDRRTLSDGRLPALVTTATFLLAGLELLYVLTG